MSEGNRFWRVSLGPHPAFPDAPSSNYVTTRERGNIPDCVPAVDVLVEMTEEEVAKAILKDPYWKVWNDYRQGVIGWNEWLNHAIHKQPQRSFIRNPSVAVKQNYYLS